MTHAGTPGHLGGAGDGVPEALREASIGLTVDVVTVTGLSAVGTRSGLAVPVANCSPLGPAPSARLIMEVKGQTPILPVQGPRRSQGLAFPCGGQALHHGV